MNLFHVCVSGPLGYILWATQVVATGIGAILMVGGGVVAGFFLLSVFTDWIVNRLVIRFHVYSDFLETVRKNALKRHNDAHANS